MVPSSMIEKGSSRSGELPWPKQKWSQDNRLVQAWTQGLTGYPFVDANMREMSLTGFMSNRGRQNVASFFCKDLGLDWRIGAEWFESQLIDYDVGSKSVPTTVHMLE